MRKTKLIIALATLVMDYLLIIASFSIAYLFRGQLDGVQLISFGQFAIFSMFVAGLYVLLFAYLRLYEYEKTKDLVDQLLDLIIGAVSATTLAGSVIYFTKNFDYSRLILGSSLVFSVIIVWLGRVLIYWFEKSLYRRSIGVTRVLIIGSGSMLDTTIRGYQTEMNKGYRIVGIINTDLEFMEEKIASIDILGSQLDEETLTAMLIKHNIHEVILTDRQIGDAVALEVINMCEGLGIRFKYIPGMFDVATARVVAHDLAGMPVIELKPTLLDGWMIVGKRLIDLSVAVLGVIGVSPILLITAILIKMTSKGPIIFKHTRIGQNGKEFQLYKFRSMYMVEKDGQLLHSSENAEIEKLKEKQPNYKLEHDPRVTKVGQFIRKTSIDELPQLWNVIKGEMSLVGPRAYLGKELDKQQAKYPQTKALVRRLLTVKPGVTGLWQISGRSMIDFTERVAMDAYYATHANIWMDLKILLQTVPVVLKGSGAM